MSGPPGGARRLVAPAKLTVSLRVLGRRADGYHELESEMVTLDLCDLLVVDPDGHGVEVVAAPGTRAGSLGGGADNLVARALGAAGRRAGVRLEKRIPVGGGLGGGSADAAAVLRWAGVTDPAVAARLGADVPFCLAGGRALVGGLGEQVRPLPFEARSFVLLVPPFSVDTAAVYRAWDDLTAGHGDAAPGRLGTRSGHGASTAGGGHCTAHGSRSTGRNELTDAALAVEPRLASWAEALAAASGQAPVLAGSGSTWWVEGTPEELGLGDHWALRVGREEGRLIPVRTVPAEWPGPPGAWEGAPAACC